MPVKCEGETILSKSFLSDSFDTVDPRAMDTGGNPTQPPGTDFNQNNEGAPPGYSQALHRKTVKELLMRRRQKWSCSQDDNNFVPKFAKCEGFGGPSGPVNYTFWNNILTPPPENDHINPQQVQIPALQGQEAPTAQVNMTLLHWQIQREALKVGQIPPELLNMQDADGDTSLHIAVAQGRRALAYALAARMAQCGSLDMKDHKGQTALQIAVATNQQYIVYDLITHGSQINTLDVWGRSPLYLCAEKGHFLSLQSIWTAVLGTGQSIDIENFNYDGLTPLHAAVLCHNGIIKELRRLGNLRSSVAMELVQRSQKYVQCIKTLLHMGASCGTQDLKSGRTSLHMASEEANMELLNIFLDQRASPSVVNVMTFSGNTALHIVSSLQNHTTQVEAVKLLMRKGADAGVRNIEKELPCQLVPEGATGEKVRLILKGKCYSG